MKDHLKIPLVIALTVIVTLLTTAHFSRNSARNAFTDLVLDAQAFNEVHRISSWDRLEQLLVRGCDKEALEYVRMEQSLGLSFLKWHLENGAKLDRKLEEEHASILTRAQSFTSKGRYDLPSCEREPTAPAPT